jgi:CO/xanthine dehydrogenase Mo-binding subunit
VAELLEAIRSMPEPSPEAGGDLRRLPGGVSNTTHGEGVQRGVGYAAGFKNICYSEGFDDYASARVRLHLAGGEPVVAVHSAAADVGQGVTTIQMQIARTELGVERVVVLPADTAVGSSGSSSASRQTWMTGGAVKAASEAVRERLLAMARARLEIDTNDLFVAGGRIVSESLGTLGDIAEILGDEVIEEEREYRHRKTFPLDPETGRGDAHVAFAFAAHRAVADVDRDLGLTRVVEIATAQDVGRALNPQAVEGQIEGGIAQGLGLALMEEIQLAGGKITNASFTDYLIPTVLDMPTIRARILELGDPESPYGIKGVGEPPTISSTPAIVAALRAASDRPLTRVPVRPDDIVGLARKRDGAVTGALESPESAAGEDEALA